MENISDEDKEFPSPREENFGKHNEEISRSAKRQLKSFNQKYQLHKNIK